MKTIPDPGPIRPFLDEAHEVFAAEVGAWARDTLAKRSPAESDEVARLVRGPREGLAATKAALNREFALEIGAALDHEAKVQAELMTRPDFKEGFAAFTEKRPPRFEGAPE